VVDDLPCRRRPEGNAVSLIESNTLGRGSGHNIHYQNRGSYFSLDEGT
jgi:gamma-glutamyltranspeptidase